MKSYSFQEFSQIQQFKNNNNSLNLETNILLQVISTFASYLVLNTYSPFPFNIEYYNNTLDTIKFIAFSSSIIYCFIITGKKLGGNFYEAKSVHI